MPNVATNDLFDHLGVDSENPFESNKDPTSVLTTLDILPPKPYSSPCKNHNPDSDASEINAENRTDVNGVIASAERLPECRIQSGGFSALDGNVWRCDIPRVNRVSFKRRRVPFRRLPTSRGSPLLNMLHRSRPDLIKGISSRMAEAPSTSSQGFNDALSQSTSENSLHSSGSAESTSTADKLRGRQQPLVTRKASVGEASGSSTPTQISKPLFRKKENKRAEIVASVTSRLYAIKKRPDPRMEALQAAEKEKDDEDDDELEELKLCKRARMKLFDLSRKLAMSKKFKRTVDSDTQTELQRSTLRVKEKCISTDQQGVVHFLNCGTNTFSDDEFHSEPEVPFVMNQLVFPNAGNFILDCGESLRVQIPNVLTNESSSQTMPLCKEQSTSAEEINVAHDGNYSDDSLESENGEEYVPTERKKKHRLMRCVSYPAFSERARHYDSDPCLVVESTRTNHTSKKAKFRINQLRPSETKRSIDSLLYNKSQSGVRIEKNREPILRFVINGTNAEYEYDPNVCKADKVIFSNNENNSNIHEYDDDPPPIRYPQFDLKNRPSLSQNDTARSTDTILSHRSHESVEENFSSGTSFVSTASSTASDSSDDFIFMDNAVKRQDLLTNRELYTISESTESCSKESTPLNSKSPRSEKSKDIIESKDSIDAGKQFDNNDTGQAESQTSKKLKWAELRCAPNTNFLNFNFTSPQFQELKEDQGNENSFPSEDSITFVFLGQSKPQTSVLLEVVKRSLMNESNTTRQSRSRNNTHGAPLNLIRSVSVDTAMIALSRLSRNQGRESDMTRSNSMENLVMASKTDFSSQFDSSNVSDANEEQKLSNCKRSQCPMATTSTNTVNDAFTETDVERKEIMTQTVNIDSMFDDSSVELPRRTMSTTEHNICESKSHRWKEIKQLILGTANDLFPNYLLETETERMPSKSGKSVSWSDLPDRNDDNESVAVNGLLDTNERNKAEKENYPTRRVWFPEAQQQAPLIQSVPTCFQQTDASLSAFIHKATSILENISEIANNNFQISEDDSNNPLLRRRNKALSKIVVNDDGPISPVKLETSVQTEVEKVDQLIQTGGFASSLVGPPVCRNFTPASEVTLCNEAPFNSTWPRRRMIGKPPTGQRPPLSPRGIAPVRSGSYSSRISTSSAHFDHSPPPSNCNSPMRRSPSSSRSVDSYSNRTYEDDSGMQDSYRLLGRAIEDDRARQRIFDDRMKKLLRSEGSYTENPARNNKYEYYSDDNASGKHSNTSAFHSKNLFRNSSFSYTRTSNSYRDMRNEGSSLRQSYNFNPRNRYSMDCQRDFENFVDVVSSPRSFSPISGKQIDLCEESTKIPNSSRIAQNPNVKVYISDPNQHSFNAPSSLIENIHSRNQNSPLISNNTLSNFGKNRISKLNGPSFRNERTIKFDLSPDHHQIENTGSDSRFTERDFYHTSNSFEVPHVVKPNSYFSLELSDIGSNSRVNSKTSCCCSCHKLSRSCGELILAKAIRHCHACCAPCAEGRKFYGSEPAIPSDVIFSSGQNTPRRSGLSPSAHLRHLISLRRTIVATDQVDFVKTQFM